MSIYYSKYTGEEVENILDSVEKKLDKLTAGNNIKIDGTTISADLSDCLDKDTDTYVESVNTSTSSSSGKAIGLDLSTSTTKVNGDRVTISGIVNLSDFALTSEVNGLVSLKQDILTAGTGIDITNNTISCTLETNVFKIVEELPTSDIDTDVIYVVPSGTTGDQNQYTEYIYVNGDWEKLGEFAASVDLSDYYTKGETYSREEIDQMITQATQGGITTVVANGSGELTLEASTSGTTATITGSVDLDNYAKTSDIPTKTSSLTNDSGYITSSDIPTLSDLGGVGSVSASGTSPLSLSASKSGTSVTISGNVDLSDYATTSDINAKLDKLTAGDNITISGTTISATNTTYSNATTSSAGLMSSSDKSNLDSLNSNAVTSVSASGTSPLTLSSSKSGNSLTISGSVDLSNYATTSSIPTKTSELTNDSGFITSTPTLSDLGGVGSVSASGTSPLTLSASKSGTSVSITGSVDLSSKLDKLTAGDNITISGSTISATNTTYTAGTNVQISSSNVISATDTTYSNATTSTAGLMSASDKSNLDTLNSNAVTSVSASGTSPLTLSASKSGNTVTVSGSVANATASTAGVVKPYTVLSSAPSVNSATTTSGRYYGVSTNSNNALVVNVPWTDTTSSLSDLGGVGTVNASGTSPLTLSASKSGTTVTVSGSVDLSDCVKTTDQFAYLVIAGGEINTGNAQLPLVLDVASSVSTTHPGTSYTISGYADASSIVYKYWNYYLFEGGSSASTVTIDGSSVSVPANTIVEGNFTDDITAIGTNNLKRIIIRGDVSLSICSSSSSSNTTLEEVDLTFSPNYSRSFNYMFANLRGLKRLRVSGGQATSANYMCYYIGYSTDDGCEIDIKGMDFSQTTSNNGVRYMCRYAKIVSIDLSGHTFNGDAYFTFGNATINSVNVSGCTFNGTLYSMFYGITANSIDLSGCDLSKVEEVSRSLGFKKLNSLNVNGLILPTDVNLLNTLLNSLNNAASIGGISGSLGLNTISDSTQGGINLSSIDLDRQSLLTIFSSLNPELSLEAILLGYTTITLSSNSYNTLTSYDIAVATDKNWAVTY